MAGFTGLLVLVSGFQGAMLIRADKTARLTAEAAKLSADTTKGAVAAAIAANQIAVTNAKQQLRAYVTAYDVIVTPHRSPGRMGAYGNMLEGPIHTYDVGVVLRNGGQTPATNVFMNVSCKPIPKPLLPDFDFPDSDLFGHGLIGPDTQLHTPIIRIPASALEKIDAAYDWFFWGWVEYDDIFDETIRHKTEFCFQIERARLAVTNEFGMAFTPYSRFNAADSDCLRPIKPHTKKNG